MTGEPLIVRRGRNDNLGNWQVMKSHTIVGNIAPGGWSRTNSQRSETSRGTAELYTDRGADVRQRDRITTGDGQVWLVVSPELWSAQHPTTGRDYSNVVFQLESVNN